MPIGWVWPSSTQAESSRNCCARYHINSRKENVWSSETSEYSKPRPGLFARRAILALVKEYTFQNVESSSSNRARNSDTS